ncbi:MAG: hypothetical protein AAF682_24740 [Planctomycetota bacterium]
MRDHPYTYASCIARSRAASWSLEDFAGLQPDFSKEFLPENLAQVRAIGCLSEAEALRLNQIRGYTYAHIFRFVEEYIIALAQQLIAEHEHESRETAREAFVLFADEERKHQQLFELFEREFEAGFESPCGVIDGSDTVGQTILAHSRLSVLLLTSMLEWLTQAHYLRFFERERAGDDLDPAFKQLFRLHWVEEAQHARLDTLETLAATERASADEREHALTELTELLGALRGLLVEQAGLDVCSLEAAIGRELDGQEREQVRSIQERAYIETFIDMGLQGDQFRALVEEVVPAGMLRLEAWRGAAA